jgi:hypothetical protein
VTSTPTAQLEYHSFFLSIAGKASFSRRLLARCSSCSFHRGLVVSSTCLPADMSADVHRINSTEGPALCQYGPCQNPKP